MTAKRTHRKAKADLAPTAENYPGLTTDPDPWYSTVTVWDGTIFQVLTPLTDQWGNQLYGDDGQPLCIYDDAATSAAADAYQVDHPYPVDDDDSDD